MTDLRTILPTPATTGKRVLNLLNGRVSLERTPPAVPTDPVWVIVPNHGAENPYGPLSWPESHGSLLPVPGAPVVLAIDDNGTPRVLSWDVIVLPVAPENVMLPTVTGGAIVGQTLTGTPGVWTGAISFAYQWERGGVPVPLETGTSYTLTSADVGFAISFSVTAENTGGPNTATSEGTPPVIAPSILPQNTALPTISGTPVQGSTLTATTGSWLNNPTYTYQWQRGGTNIGGATSSTYPLVLADVGFTLNVVVTATNGSGPASATSRATPAITGNADPMVTVLPTIRGTTVEGSTLVCSTGTWTGSPTLFAYQWQRVPAAGSAPGVVQTAQASNGSASPQTATLTSVVAGHALVLFATCKSGSGGMAVSSVSGGEAAGHSWARKIGPVTIGFGGTLDQEMWYLDNAAAGSPTITVAYSGTLSATAEAFWVAEVSGLTGFDNAGVTTALNTDPLAELITPATANELVIAFASLSAVASVNPPAPWTNLTGPQTFSSNINPVAYATTTGTTPLTAEWTAASGYWAVCQALFKTASGGGSATNISGATSSSYPSVVGDVGSQLQCVVTATNTVGSTAATSPATSVVTAPATNAPFGQLIDSLMESSLSALFTNAAGTVTATTGGVQLACLSGATGSALASVAPRSLVGSSLFMQATVPAYGSGTKSSDLGAADTQVLASLANGVFFDISQGSGALAGVYAIRGILVQAGVTTHSTQIAYNATSHSCLRVREQSGELFWDTSPDGNAWTPLWSSTYTMSQATLGALYAVAETNYSGTEVASVLVVENANTVPGPSGGVVPGPYQTLVWSDEFTGTSLDTTKWTTPLPPPPPSTGPNISSADLTAMGITVGARLDPGDATMLTPSHWGLVAGSLPHNQANGSATTNNPALAKFGQSHYGGPTDSYLHCSIASGQGIWGVADKMPAPNAKWIVEFSVKMGGPNATHAYGWGSGWVLGVLGSGNSQEVDTIEFAGWSGSGDPGEPSCTTRNNVGTPVNFPGTSQPGYYNPSFVCSDGNFHTYTLCWDPVTGKQTLVWDGVQQYSIAIPSPSVAMQLNITTGYSGNSLLPPGGITGTNLIQADMVFKYIRYWAAT